VPVVAQAGDDAATAVAQTYRRFARLEARGRSAAYEALAESVASDTALVSFIASLPLDITRDDDTRWLSCLVWPGEGDRAQRLEAAIASARRDPPAVHPGDMLNRPDREPRDVAAMAALTGEPRW